MYLILVEGEMVALVAGKQLAEAWLVSSSSSSSGGCSLDLCLAHLAALFCFAAVNIAHCLFLYVANKHNRERARAAAAAAAVTVFAAQTSNYYTAPAFIQLSHTCTGKRERVGDGGGGVYYRLSLCDGTEQQELYTFIKQPTCHCIYNNYWLRQKQQLTSKLAS